MSSQIGGSSVLGIPDAAVAHELDVESGFVGFLEDIPEELGFFVGVERMFLAIVAQPLAANEPAETVMPGIEVGIGGQRQAEEVHSPCYGCSVTVAVASTDPVCWIA